MPNEGIEGDEWGAYVVLGRFAVTEHGMAYRTRVPGSRSANSTRGSDAPPGRTGKPCTGGSGTGGRMPRTCEVREMRNAEAELIIIHQGKPPALLGDSQSLTVPGVCRSGAMTASPHGRLAYPIPRMECLVLTLRLR